MRNDKFSASFSVADLLEKINKNRDQHKADYEKAFIAYKAEMLKFVDEKKKEIEGWTKPQVIYFNVRVPEQHLDDYDTIIKMLKMTKNDNVTLSMEEFDMYVNNNFPWRDSFLSNTMWYLGR